MAAPFSEPRREGVSSRDHVEQMIIAEHGRISMIPPPVMPGDTAALDRLAPPADVAHMSAYFR